MMVPKLITTGMDLSIFQVESSEVGSDKHDESILSFRRQRTCLKKSNALIMVFSSSFFKDYFFLYMNTMPWLGNEI